MKRICAWCGKSMNQVLSDKVSHGICKKCEEQFRKQINIARLKKKAKEDQNES